MNGMEVGRVCFPATAMGWSLSLFHRKKPMLQPCSYSTLIWVDPYFSGGVLSDQPL